MILVVWHAHGLSEYCWKIVEQNKYLLAFTQNKLLYHPFVCFVLGFAAFYTVIDVKWSNVEKGWQEENIVYLELFLDQSMNLMRRIALHSRTWTVLNVHTLRLERCINLSFHTHNRWQNDTHHTRKVLKNHLFWQTFSVEFPLALHFHCFSSILLLLFMHLHYTCIASILRICH